MIKQILIGADCDLHRGYHTTLLDDPPSSFRYVKSSAIHYFPVSRKEDHEFSPYEHPHWGEFLDFQDGPQLVHSARLPVLQRKTWITDMDDFGAAVLGGRFMWSPGFGDLARQNECEFQEYIRQRARWMLSGYTHRSCKAVLFWSSRGLSDAEEWLRRLNLQEFAEVFLRKCHVLYPALPPAAQEAVEAKWVQNPKWDQNRQIQILFCGRDYEVKNGALALQVFAALAEQIPNLVLHYIGNIPQRELEKGKEIFNRVRHYPKLSRPEVLFLLKDSHILFHPSKAESLGMILIEAAASGVAIVTVKGRRMRHIEELLDERGSLILDRRSMSKADEVAWFQKALHSLALDRSRAARMGYHNYELVRAGKFNLEKRNQFLSALYSEALDSPEGEGFSLESMSDFSQAKLFSLSSDNLHAAWVSHRQNTGINVLNLYI